MKLNERVYLALLSASRCKVRLSLPTVAAIQENDYVSQVYVNGQPWVSGQPALISIDENRDAWITLTNVSPSRILERGTPVGQIEECEVITECVGETQVMAVNENKDSNVISKQDKEFIDSKANIECKMQKRYTTETYCII